MTPSTTDAEVTVLHSDAANDELSQTQIDQLMLDKHLASLKALDLSEATVNVFVVKSSDTNEKKRFQAVMRLPCQGALNSKFKGYVANYIKDYQHISELRDIHTDQDNRFFYVESTATDFQQVIALINAEQSPRPISNETDLNRFNGYVIKLTVRNEDDSETNLYAFRHVATAWSVKNSANLAIKFNPFDNQLVADVIEEHRFTITPMIDLIQLGEHVFITNIKQFEKAMRYQERLQERKDEAIAALTTSNTLTKGGGDILSRVIGTDKHLMRQLASVHSKPYYNNDIWLTKLKEVAGKPESSHWLIKYDAHDQIIVQEDKTYVWELLTLLQNKRVRTVVDGVEQDVDGELVNLPAAS